MPGLEQKIFPILRSQLLAVLQCRFTAEGMSDDDALVAARQAFEGMVKTAANQRAEVIEEAVMTIRRELTGPEMQDALRRHGLAVLTARENG